MNRKIIFLLFTIFFINIIKGQQFDLNNIKINDVKNLLGNVLEKEEKNKTNWSGTKGDSNFNVADRMAINDVIDAYGIYWDTNNLEGYLSLFTDDALGVINDLDGKKTTYLIKDKVQSAISAERMRFFKINNMQRRHMMSNAMLIELTDDSAYLKKYMMLLTTNNNSKTEIVSPIFYDFKLKKIDGIWKIAFREINLDRPLDLELKP